MVFTVRSLRPEPIAIVTLALPLDRYPRGLSVVHQRLDHLAHGTPTPLTVIFDLSGQEPSFSDILLWLAEQGPDVPGSIADPRLRPLLVGTHPVLTIAVKKASQKLGVELLHFPTLEPALDHARAPYAGLLA